MTSTIPATALQQQIAQINRDHRAGLITNEHRHALIRLAIRVHAHG